MRLVIIDDSGKAHEVIEKLEDFNPDAQLPATALVYEVKEMMDDIIASEWAEGITFDDAE